MINTTTQPAFTLRQFNAATLKFIDTAQANIAAHFARHCPALTVPTLMAETNRRYVKVIQYDDYANHPLDRRQVFCFIDRRTGNVLKANSWRAPHPLPRGSIFDASNGAEAVNVFGANYAR